MAGPDAAAGSDTALVDRVLALARDLRSCGGHVAATEVSDALTALETVPLERRAAVRATLEATLCKEQTLRDVFGRLFDSHFPLARIVQPAPVPGERPDAVREVADALRSGDTDTLRDLVRRRVSEQGDVQPGANVTPDAFVFRALRGLNLDAVRDAMRDQAVDGEGRSVLQRRLVESDLTGRIDAFRGMLREEVISAMAESYAPEDLAARERRVPPDEVDFVWASETDLERMRAVLAPLSRRLTQRLSHRRRRSRRGRLDVRRTLRRSLSSGGALTDPAFRRPVAGKPELVVLCDISGSMRAFARFTLELTYALVTQFQQVRTFVFIDTVDEVTDLLKDSGDLGTALAAIDTQADVVAYDGQSWYGQSFERFWKMAGSDLAPRSTVLVVGDARNNFRSTGHEHLQRVRDQVRRVYWLNPEPREHWDSGDSEMQTFVPACHGVYEVRNLTQLATFVEQVL